ncbi:hypothetical protein GF325_11675, partial [Candidatus Bathyarchaeota archaeon]|nr:hypothetical protein [Candidatus Bathyarchaeota archaeon]
MIITSQKPLNEIFEMIESSNRLLIVGCDGCFQPPRSEREAEMISLMLSLKDRIDERKPSSFSSRVMTVMRQCDDRITATSIRPTLKNFDPDAILSLACGIGVQVIARLNPHLQVYPGQDTLFMGAELHENGTYEEFCSGCGDCMLGYTGGVCPVTLCAKNLMNGPCGGTIDGKCEVGSYTRPCAWVEIWRKLKNAGRLDIFKKFRMPVDYRLSSAPRDVKKGQVYQ